MYNYVIVVVIIDPGIKAETGYSPYDEGVQMGIFIKVTSFCLFFQESFHYSSLSLSSSFPLLPSLVPPSLVPPSLVLPSLLFLPPSPLSLSLPSLSSSILPFSLFLLIFFHSPPHFDFQNKDGKVFTGKVWPGITAFPDFFHPDANMYWEKQVIIQSTEAVWTTELYFHLFCRYLSS